MPPAESNFAVIQFNADDRRWPPIETAQSTVIAISVFAAAIAPLALPVMVLLLAFITLAENPQALSKLSDLPWRLAHNRAALAALAFITFAVASTMWSIRPAETLKSLAQILMLGFASWYVAATLSQQIATLKSVRRTRFLRAVALPALFIGFYFAIDFLTGSSVTLFFARNFPRIFDGFENTFIYDANRNLIGLDESYFNRIVAALALLCVGIVAALQFWPRPRWGLTLGLTACLGMAAIGFSSGSATALLALATSVLAFNVALMSPRWATRLLQTMFVIVMILAIPLSMVPGKLGLQNNPHLPVSFRERAIIWNDLANLSLERPWFGIGVKSVKFLSQQETKLDSEIAIGAKQRAYVHPHNGYLEVWVELGAVGAILFTLAGLLSLNRILSLPPAMQKFALALAAGTLTIIGPGWSLWQPWLIAAIGVGWIALMMSRSEFERVRGNAIAE
mgnify:CR=1 FL=1